VLSPIGEGKPSPEGHFIMEYQAVSSTSVAAVAYDVASSTLGVRFLKGGEYHYYGVPQEVHEGIFGSSSVGSYIDQYVKKAGYAFAKVG
jgi:hypothetical protein